MVISPELDAEIISHSSFLGNPDAFFVLNGDVCAEFPLNEMLKFHESQTFKVTVMATEATKAQSMTYGCIVEDKNNHTMLHYVEKVYYELSQHLGLQSRKFWLF